MSKIKINPADFHHKACADVLMKDFGVPREKILEVIALVKEIYDADGFAHCLIILSVGGFKESRRTLKLKYFLQEHGTQQPSRTKAKMLDSDEY